MDGSTSSSNALRSRNSFKPVNTPQQSIKLASTDDSKASSQLKVQTDRTVTYFATFLFLLVVSGLVYSLVFLTQDVSSVALAASKIG